ncbi:hypothetical protein [Sphingopyxis chilensis]|uniref:hypothetical protein n=1 Tax=Sphingopyxis chilensis TaxID=180400 RepID=UPI002DDCE4E9|nr:hypothetical protein [Sphingopyxis chilensis]
MNSAPQDADLIIDKIDAGELAPSTLPIVRAFHEHITLKHPLQREALEAFDQKAVPAVLSAIQSRIWQEIDRLGPSNDSGLRLSNCLVRPDEPVDWHLAEYLIDWARQQGLSEQQIIGAFAAAKNGS